MLYRIRRGNSIHLLLEWADNSFGIKSHVMLDLKDNNVHFLLDSVDSSFGSKSHVLLDSKDNIYLLLNSTDIL